MLTAVTTMLSWRSHATMVTLGLEKLSSSTISSALTGKPERTGKGQTRDDSKASPCGKFTDLKSFGSVLLHPPGAPTLGAWLTSSAGWTSTAAADAASRCERCHLGFHSQTCDSERTHQTSVGRAAPNICSPNQAPFTIPLT